MKELQVARLSTATIYRLFFLGSLFGCIPIFFLFGILGYFGLGTLAWNNQPLTGWTAVIAGPFIGAFFALFGTATFGSAVALGLWLKSRLGPLAIQYRDSNSDS
jgi:hypothetical protein